MITPPTKSFFVIHIHGEAADLVTSKLSPAVMADIREAVLISDDYAEDIQAHNEMNDTVAKLQHELGNNIDVAEQYNPLYIPSSQEQIDSMLEGDPATESFKFTGMDSNPFTLKSVSIKRDDVEVIGARVACHQFDLPPYSEIIAAQQTARPN